MALLVVFLAILKILQISKKYKNKTNVAPTIPVSSTIIGYIKSVWASGRYKYFWVLLPNPFPKSPPLLIAIYPLHIWLPVVKYLSQGDFILNLSNLSLSIKPGTFKIIMVKTIIIKAPAVPPINPIFFLIILSTGDVKNITAHIIKNIIAVP